MSQRTVWSAVVGVLVAATSGFAQSAVRTDLPPLLPEVEEIALARSAAPESVSKDATVLVLKRGGYVVAEQGTSGVTCYVGRSHPESLEPHCFDAEGSSTILQLELRKAELRERGQTPDEVERRIRAELRSGALKLPSRPAMSYMMSSGQVLYDGDRRVGRWKPHLMIYVPYITPQELGFGDASPLDEVMVFGPGEPTANILVVVEGFVEPRLVR